MKHIFVSLICLTGLLLFITPAGADFKTFVVYQNGEEPCITVPQDSRFEYDPVGDYFCFPEVECTNENGCQPTQCTNRTTESGCHNAIQEAVCASPGHGGTIVICPGAYNGQEYVPYKENILVKGGNYTIKSFSGNPADTIVEARNPDQNVFFLSRNHSRTIEGLTIRGAWGVGDGIEYPTQYGCIKRYDENGNKVYEFLEDPPQPCAGIRSFGTMSDTIKNNIITQNHRGIIIKDTHTWYFFNMIENNTISYNTSIGLSLHYGQWNYVTNNVIYGNPDGIQLVNTLNNVINGNTVRDNTTLGIRLKDFKPNIDTIYNNFYNNNLIDNATDAQVKDEHPSDNWWNHPDGLGNYWSDWDEETIPFPTTYYDYFPRASLYVPGSTNPDGDDFENYEDNCPNVHNNSQSDVEPPANDGIGDACECDVDYYVKKLEDTYDVPFPYKFTSISEAISAINEMNEKPDNLRLNFMLKHALFDEDLIIDQSGVTKNAHKNIIFFNGYDCEYLSNIGAATLKGQLTVTSGNLFIRNGTFKVAKTN